MKSRHVILSKARRKQRGTNEERFSLRVPLLMSIVPLSSSQSTFVARHIKKMQVFRAVRIMLSNLNIALTVLVDQALGKLSFFFNF